MKLLNSKCSLFIDLHHFVGNLFTSGDTLNNCILIYVESKFKQTIATRPRQNIPRNRQQGHHGLPTQKKCPAGINERESEEKYTG